MRQGIIEAPEDLAGTRRACRVVEFPELHLERFPDTFLTARGEPEANAACMVPVIWFQFRQLLGRPESDQHAEELCCTSCLIQCLVIKPIRANNPIEAAQNVILEWRDGASLSLLDQRLKLDAAFRDSTIKVMKLVVPFGLRLANQWNFMTIARAHNRKGPLPTPATPSCPVILCQACRAEHCVRV